MRKSLLAIVIILVMILFAGCFWQDLFNKPSSDAPDKPQSQPENIITDNDLSLAKANVKAYIESMQNAEFSRAYEFLSEESKSLHSLSEFTHDIKQGMPPLDLSTIKAQEAENEGMILVSIDFNDEPGTAGYYLMRENGNWVIVYRGGSPAMPSAEK